MSYFLVTLTYRKHKFPYKNQQSISRLFNESKVICVPEYMHTYAYVHTYVPVCVAVELLLNFKFC